MAESWRAQVVITAVDQASGPFGRMAASAQGMAQRIVQSSAQVRAAGMALTAVGGAGVLAARNAVNAAAVEEQAQNRLRVIYGQGADELIRYAAELQKVTRFGDEQMIQAAAIGSTYVNLRGDMKQAMDTAANMAEAYGMDLTQAMHMLGKASSGMVGNMRRVGIMVDMNDFKARGMAAVYDTVAKETKNAATRTESLSKSMAMARNAVGDMWESVGFALVPALKAMTPLVQQGAEALNRLSQTTIGRVLITGAAGMAALAAATGPLLIALPSLVAGYGMVKAAIAGTTVVTNALKLASTTTAGVQIAKQTAVAASATTSAAVSEGAWVGAATNSAVAAEIAGDRMIAKNAQVAQSAAMSAGMARTAWLSAAAVAGGLVVAGAGIVSGYTGGRAGQGAGWGGFLAAAGGGAAVGAAKGGLIGAGIGFAAGGISYMGAHYAGKRGYEKSMEDALSRWGELTPQEQAAFAAMGEEQRRKLFAQGFEAIKAETGMTVARQAAEAAGGAGGAAADNAAAEEAARAMEEAARKAAEEFAASQPDPAVPEALGSAADLQLDAAQAQQKAAQALQEAAQQQQEAMMDVKRGRAAYGAAMGYQQQAVAAWRGGQGELAERWMGRAQELAGQARESFLSAQEAGVAARVAGAGAAGVPVPTPATRRREAVLAAGAAATSSATTPPPTTRATTPPPAAARAQVQEVRIVFPKDVGQNLATILRVPENWRYFCDSVASALKSNRYAHTDTARREGEAYGGGW